MERETKPIASTVACPSCGEPVDALRAGHVAILDGVFRYFCDEACKRAFVLGRVGPPPSEVETAEPPRVQSAARVAAEVPSPEPKVVSAPVAGLDERAPTGTASPPPLDAGPPSSVTRPSSADDRLADPAPAPPQTAEAAPPSIAGYAQHLVAGVGIAAGCLTPALGLLGPSAQSSRLALATVALFACCARALLTIPRDPSDVHPVVSTLSVAGVWGVALYAREGGEPAALGFASLAGLAAAIHLVSSAIVDRAREGVRSARAWIQQRLDVPTEVIRAGVSVTVRASDIKRGEEVTAATGDTLGVDARVIAGEARVTPWLDSDVEVPRREGDAVVAGARVVAGRLRAVTTWSGSDRAWLKLVDAPALRPDVVGPLPRRVRLSVERGALVAGAVVAAIAMANRASGLDAVMMAAVAVFSIAGTHAVGIVALHQARGPISALAHGVVFRDAAAFDRAGRADIAVLCSRSTLLMGALEIVALETLSSLDVGRVLALAAGSSTVSPHASSAALLEAAHARGEPPEAVRHANYHAGLGVTALAANGERLVVGSRGLLLREKVSIALAESRVSQLEGEGRSVTLVALGGRLVGLVALQDGLRPGARAAVQRLLDAGIEPVLLSGEARETCETIGRAVDVGHIRPEVLPQDRGTEVRALADGGHVVAVLGSADADGEALGAADVSVALGAAGASPGDWSISLASNDVRDAARALAIAVETRQRTRVAIALGLGPAAVVSVAIALGLVPLALGPLVSLAGLGAAVVHARR